jgi:hypothetical protein
MNEWWRWFGFNLLMVGLLVAVYQAGVMEGRRSARRPVFLTLYQGGKGSTKGRGEE